MNLCPLNRNDSCSTESRNNSKNQQLAEGPGCLGGGAGHTCTPQPGLWDWFYSLLSCRWESYPMSWGTLARVKLLCIQADQMVWGEYRAMALSCLLLLSTAGWAMCLQSVRWVGSPGKGVHVVKCFVFTRILEVLYCWLGTLCTRFWEQWLLKYICKGSDP